MAEVDKGGYRISLLIYVDKIKPESWSHIEILP